MEEITTLEIEGEEYVFWPPFDPLADVVIRLRELVEFADRNDAAFQRFLKMKRLH